MSILRVPFNQSLSPNILQHFYLFSRYLPLLIFDMSLGKWVCIKGMVLSILMCIKYKKDHRVSWIIEGTRLSFSTISVSLFCFFFFCFFCFFFVIILKSWRRCFFGHIVYSQYDLLINEDQHLFISSLFSFSFLFFCF